MPQTHPSHEHALFARFIGDWVGDERVAATEFGPAGTAHARMSFHTVADGMFLFVYYVEDVGPGVIGHGMIGFDKKRGVYTLHWFDNAGMPSSTIATAPANGDDLAFEADYGWHLGRTVFNAGDSELRFRIEMQKPEHERVVVVEAVLAKIDAGSTIEDARGSSTLRSR